MVSESRGTGRSACYQYSVALQFAVGKQVPVDNREAVKWFRKAAEQGHADAQEKSRLHVQLRLRECRRMIGRQ